VNRELKAYEAEYRRIAPPQRSHKVSGSDWERIIVIAPTFDDASILAQDYGKKNFPKLTLVSVELNNERVTM
jgi:hypothetical protein